MKEIIHLHKIDNSANHLLISSSKNKKIFQENGLPINLKCDNIERQFCKEALKSGWNVMNRGWPDFLLYTDNDIVFVEIKQDEEQLNPYQKELLNVFARHGLRCFVWRPKTKLREIKNGKLISGRLHPKKKWWKKLLGK